MRPLSNVVDATNYAMLERGQPLHAFDLDPEGGARGAPRLRRRADDHLDDVERVSSAEDLVIADSCAGRRDRRRHRPGRAEVRPRHATCCSRRRTSIAWASSSPRAGSAVHGGVERFERGADPECRRRRRTQRAALITEWSVRCSLLAAVIDVRAAPPRRHVAVRPSRAAFLLATRRRRRRHAGRLRRGSASRPTVAGADAVDVEVPGLPGRPRDRGGPDRGGGARSAATTRCPPRCRASHRPAPWRRPRPSARGCA